MSCLSEHIFRQNKKHLLLLLCLKQAILVITLSLYLKFFQKFSKITYFNIILWGNLYGFHSRRYMEGRKNTIVLYTRKYCINCWGIRVIPLKWFLSFLSGRQKMLKINYPDKDNHASFCSNKIAMNVGIPQGSVLGSGSFSIYIIELPEARVAAFSHLYAFSATLLGSEKTSSHTQESYFLSC